MALIAVKMLVDMHYKKLYKEVNRARRTWLTQSAKLLQREAKASIKKRKTVSVAGDPPIGKSGNLRRSIRYLVGRSNAWVGPTAPLGSHANILERGSRLVEPRPFMGPAFERVKPKIRRFRKL